MWNHKTTQPDGTASKQREAACWAIRCICCWSRMEKAGDQDPAARKSGPCLTPVISLCLSSCLSLSVRLSVSVSLSLSLSLSHTHSLSCSLFLSLSLPLSLALSFSLSYSHAHTHTLSLSCSPSLSLLLSLPSPNPPLFPLSLAPSRARVLSSSEEERKSGPCLTPDERSVVVAWVAKESVCRCVYAHVCVCPYACACVSVVAYQIHRPFTEG